MTTVKDINKEISRAKAELANQFESLDGLEILAYAKTTDPYFFTLERYLVPSVCTEFLIGERDKIDTYLYLLLECDGEWGLTPIEDDFDIVHDAIVWSDQNEKTLTVVSEGYYCILGILTELHIQRGEMARIQRAMDKDD
jgi:hypothetical protein